MPLEIAHLSSTHDLRRHAEAWDDLWQRSETASPSARAEPLALWLDHFARRSQFRAVVVAESGRFVAALPLIGRKLKRLVTVAALPQNEWSSGGDLLLDVDADAGKACGQLLAGIEQTAWPLMWLDELPYESPRWQSFAAAARDAGWLFDLTVEQERVAQVEVTGDWARYDAALDGDHRRSRRRYARKFLEAGPTQLQVLHPTDPAEIHRLVRQAFTIEDESWKGSEGSSVMKQTGMLDFFQAQSRALAELGHLELVFLQHQGRPIAFAYVWRSKGVRFLAKLGYDDTFRKLGPGQHMMYQYLEHLHADPDCRLLDFWGPLKPWNQAWATRTYPLGKLVLAPRSAVSRGLFYAYTALRPGWRAVRRRWPTPRALTAETE